MNFDEAHREVDALLTSEGVAARSLNARLTHFERMAIETVLRTALDKADPIVTCGWCGESIVYVEGRWVDKGTKWLCFCTDQDETHDRIRHAP